MGDELARLDATAQAELVRSGEASPSELVDAAIERIEATNGELNAVIHPLYEKAREWARGELPDGYFRGVPLLLKDMVTESAGDPMHEGMKHLRDLNWVEKEDSYLTTRYRRAGFVICGKTNCSELGILPTAEPEAYGATRNPWALDRSTGGSSGGAGASVAAGMVPVAHGTDGGGSIRIPASACGLVGLKPTRARITLGPDFGDIYSGLDHQHVLARSVRDSAAVLDCTHGPAPGDPYAAPGPDHPYVEDVEKSPGSLRIGLRTDAPSGQFEVHPDCVAAAEDAARLLESLGHSVEPSHPEALDDEEYVQTFIMRWSSGIAWALDHWSRKTGKDVGPDGVEATTWALAEAGRATTAPGYLGAIEYQQKAARSAAEWWDAGFDVLLTPTMGEPPTPLGAYEAPADAPEVAILRAVPVAGFTAFWNATGQPAISLPLHWNDDGLPIGVQLVAEFGREDLLLRVASQLEQARPWADRTPPVFAEVTA